MGIKVNPENSNFIKEAAEKNGVRNLRFFFPWRDDGRKDPKITECFAYEGFNRRIIEDNYKMKLYQVNNFNAGCEDFYISDFESMCRKSPEFYWVETTY